LENSGGPLTSRLDRSDNTVAYGSPDSLNHEGVRGRGREPSHDLQLDFRRQGRVRAYGGRVNPHLRRHPVARRERAPGRRRIGEHGEYRADGVSLLTSVQEPAAATPAEPELSHLFHQLNNQLGIILAHAELLEAKAPDAAYRARATQVIKSVLDAMGTAKEIRRTSVPQGAV